MTDIKPSTSGNKAVSAAKNGGGTSSIISKLGTYLVKPVTKDNLLLHYVPLQGVVCYSVMSVNVMNPRLFTEYCSQRNISNLLLCGSLGGIGLYIYNRPHLRKFNEVSRIGYSAFGAVMFTFGSVLLWAIMRNQLPENIVLCSSCGILAAASLIKGGKSYCKAVDQQCIPSTSPSAQVPD